MDSLSLKHNVIVLWKRLKFGYALHWAQAGTLWRDISTIAFMDY
ncbi:MAG: hypothetical protein ACREAZ_04970 [Nitrososphaera sp.]